jgi:hypothetical protein
MYILTNFYGKKICAGSFDKCNNLFIYGKQWAPLAKLYKLVEGEAVLIRQYKW